MSSKTQGLIVTPSKYLILPILFALVFMATAIIEPVYDDFLISKTGDETSARIQDATANVEQFLQQARKRFIRAKGEKLYIKEQARQTTTSTARSISEQAEPPARTKLLQVEPTPKTAEPSSNLVQSERLVPVSSDHESTTDQLAQEFDRLGNRFLEENYGESNKLPGLKTAFLAFSTVGEREALYFLENELDKLREGHTGRIAVQRLKYLRTMSIGPLTIPVRPIYSPVTWLFMMSLLALVLGFFRLQVLDTLQNQKQPNNAKKGDEGHDEDYWGSISPPIWLAPMAPTGWHLKGIKATDLITKRVGWTPARSRMNSIAIGVMLLALLAASIRVLFISLELSEVSPGNKDFWSTTLLQLWTIRIASIALFFLTWGWIGVTFVTWPSWPDEGLMSERRSMIFGGMAFAAGIAMAPIPYIITLFRQQGSPRFVPPAARPRRLSMITYLSDGFYRNSKTSGGRKPVHLVSQGRILDINHINESRLAEGALSVTDHEDRKLIVRWLPVVKLSISLEEYGVRTWQAFLHPVNEAESSSAEEAEAALDLIWLALSERGPTSKNEKFQVVPRKLARLFDLLTVIAYRQGLVEWQEKLSELAEADFNKVPGDYEIRRRKLRIERLQEGFTQANAEKLRNYEFSAFTLEKLRNKNAEVVWKMSVPAMQSQDWFKLKLEYA